MSETKYLKLFKNITFLNSISYYLHTTWTESLTLLSIDGKTEGGETKFQMLKEIEFYTKTRKHDNSIFRLKGNITTAVSEFVFGKN